MAAAEQPSTRRLKALLAVSVRKRQADRGYRLLVPTHTPADRKGRRNTRGGAFALGAIFCSSWADEHALDDWGLPIDKEIVPHADVCSQRGRGGTVARRTTAIVRERD